MVRYGLDEMFDIQCTLWGNTVLPGVKQLEADHLGITGTTVADWMTDLQTDATAMPGKAFDLYLEMPEPDVGIMTFNRCVAVDQWEGMEWRFSMRSEDDPVYVPVELGTKLPTRD